MSGVTVVVNDVGSSDVAVRVRQSSRELYARKAEPIEPTTAMAKPVTASRVRKKNQSSELAVGDLKAARSLD